MNDICDFLRQRVVRVGGLVLGLALTACTVFGPAAAPPTPVPTPFGTVVATSVPAIEAAGEPTSTPPPRQCIFPMNLGEEAGVHEAVLYRFTWQGIPQTLETRGGPLRLEGGSTIALGERQIMIVHSAPLPESIRLDTDFEPGGTLLLEPLSLAQAIHAPDGRVVAQALGDPRDDVPGLPADLDIVLVERLFGAGEDFIMRVTRAEPDDGRQIWTFEGVEISLGDYRYVARMYADGDVLNLVYDPDGEYSDWEGAAILQGPVTTWAFASGGDLTFGAQTVTSAANGDTTARYPLDIMAEIWSATQRNCGG